MDKLPFSIYDFFGYLAAGFLFLIATDRAFDWGWIINRNIDFITGAFLVTLTYILGQIIANLSGFIIEKKLTRDFLGSTERVLFNDVIPGAAYLFPGYYQPLPKLTRERILAKASAAGVTTPSAALFFHCHSIVKRDRIVLDRLDAFLKLYGFCRNVCMAATLSSVVLAIGGLVALYKNLPAAQNFWWSGFALFVALGMFYRYLKFYRQYALEVFISYSEAA